MDLRDKEVQVLRHLSKRANDTNINMVAALASEGTKWADGPNAVGGSNGAAPMIFAWWSKRLLAGRFIRKVEDSKGRYTHHEITDRGRQALARHLQAAPRKYTKKAA